jgi:hydroxyethylthiazole kinase-like uncharacterized protein yjeF
MHRVASGQPHFLFDVAGTRAIELAVATKLPPHTLMQRAGLQVARLAMAIAPHSSSIWLACGPGNNGGDGLEAAMHLKRWGKNAVVTWLGDEARAPVDALLSLHRARAEGVTFSTEPPAHADLYVDALLGIGSKRQPEGRVAELIAHMHSGNAPVLAVDIASALDADTGDGKGCVTADFTLSLLTLKPGLFTAAGRDASGEIWFDDLGIDTDISSERPFARLPAAPRPASRTHASHKGSYGDVAVIGGASGMTGATLLAGTAALHAGAGRVFISLLADGATGLDPLQPELMFRSFESLQLDRMNVVCGCGAGDTVRQVMPRVCSTSACLVLDADALNAIATDAQFQSLVQARAGRAGPTILTPHPLEAARLLGTSTAQVQSNRLAAAALLADKFKCVVVLKGSGTIIAAPGQTSVINTTGNGRLATAGTGDVLAGFTGALLAAGLPPFQAACEAVFLHGLAADQWSEGTALTAGSLARSISRDRQTASSLP